MIDNIQIFFKTLCSLKIERKAFLTAFAGFFVCAFYSYILVAPEPMPDQMPLLVAYFFKTIFIVGGGFLPSLLVYFVIVFLSGCFKEVLDDYKSKRSRIREEHKRLKKSKEKSLQAEINKLRKEIESLK